MLKGFVRRTMAVWLVLCVLGSALAFFSDRPESARRVAGAIPSESEPERIDPAVIPSSFEPGPLPLRLAVAQDNATGINTIEIVRTDGSAFVSSSNGPTLEGRIRVTMTLDESIEDKTNHLVENLTIDRFSGSIEESIPLRVDAGQVQTVASSHVVTFPVTFTASGTHTFRVSYRNQSREFSVSVSTRNRGEIPVPRVDHIEETYHGVVYRYPGDSSVMASPGLRMLSASPTITVRGSAGGRKVALLREDGAERRLVENSVVEASDVDGSATTPDDASTALLMPGANSLSLVDLWDHLDPSPNRRTSFGLRAPTDRLAPPVVTHFSNTLYLPPARLGSTEIAVSNDYLVLRGSVARGTIRNERDLSFVAYKRRSGAGDGPFTFVGSVSVERFERIGEDGWEATLRVPPLQRDELGHLYVMAPGQQPDVHVVSTRPVAFQLKTPTGEPASVAISKIEIVGGDETERISGQASRIQTNARFLAFSLETTPSESLQDTQVALFRSEESTPFAFAPAAEGSRSGWIIETPELEQGEHRIHAKLFRGDLPIARTSPELTIAVNRESPRVVSVEPSNFGTAPRVHALTVQFGGNPIDSTTAERATNYVLYPSIGDGVFGAEQLSPVANGVRYDTSRNAVTLVFDQNAIRPNLYQLELVSTPVAEARRSLTLARGQVVPPEGGSTASGLRDIFGNPLQDEQGQVGRTVRVQLGRTPTQTGAAAAEDRPREEAPYVSFKEYTEPREIPDGFQFSDQVVTRVSRLYYYRDAHRVAEIINRKAKSYNRVAVDKSRRLAEEQRHRAHALEVERKEQELKAIEASRLAREAEDRAVTAQGELEQARARAQALQAQVARVQTQKDVGQRAPTAEEIASLDSQIQQFEALQAQAPLDPISLRELERLRALRNRQPLSAPEVANLELELGRLQRELSAVEASIPTLERTIAQGPEAVQSARRTEATARQQLQRTALLEDEARAEQFRLEVAAAHEDPDTFAPGKPDSSDPVEQVSVSVIGEGELQLRGPLKGVNTIRTMVNQIDAPVGQVQVGVHTVQINGERGDRLEQAAARIGVHLDQARFLTVQSGQMLRKAVVLVASRRAAEAEALCGPGADQEIRDLKYVESFFGTDFVRELRAIDSEFLKSGNKVLSIHSMDSTSLASALFLIALAKNDTRQEILAEFRRMVETELPPAEMRYVEAHGHISGPHPNHPKIDAHFTPPLQFLATNARFEAINGYFDSSVIGPDTLNPIQREFIRLAQIFKSRLVTELQLAQRVKERALIEERLGNRLEELKNQKLREEQAERALIEVQAELQETRRDVLVAFNSVSAEILRVMQGIDESRAALDDINVFTDTFIKDHLDASEQLARQLERTIAPKSPLFESLRRRIGRARASSEASVEGEREIMRLGNRASEAANIYKELQSWIHFSINPQRLAIDMAGLSRDILVDQASAGVDFRFPIPIAGGRTIVVAFDREGLLKVPPPDGEALRPRNSGTRSSSLTDAQPPWQGEQVQLNQVQRQYRRWLDQVEFAQVSFAKFEYQTPRYQRLLDESIAQFEKIKEYDSSQPLRFDHFVVLANILDLLGRVGEGIEQTKKQIDSDIHQLAAALAEDSSNIDGVFRRYVDLRSLIFDSIRGELEQYARGQFGSLDRVFQTLLDASLQFQFARRNAEENRQPIDHKKLLDMLIDEMEDKYIELLEGTRSHTAVVDGYIKAIGQALADDFNAQFYEPAFRLVRQTGRTRDVQLGQIETTTVLTNNRGFGKVEPQAIMEFDLPKRDIVITEAMNGAKALVDEYGALLTDPTFLSATKLLSGQPTSSMAQGTLGGGASAVRDVLPGLSRSDDEEILRQVGPGRREFGSALEALIPDPAIYKFETGTGYEIRPVIQPDGQAVTFHFNYMYTTNVREPVRPDEKHLGRVKRHFIDTDVQLGNYELREVSTYRVGLRASRTSRGVPLLEDIPAVGTLFRPLPSDESSLQQNIILAQATIFPTLFDLMGLRFAPAVADLDTLRLRNEDFVVRGRYRDLSNHVYDISTTRVDDSLRVPPAERRGDLYRTQETIPGVHPNGYKGPGLNLRDSRLEEGYDPADLYPPDRFYPSDSDAHRLRSPIEGSYDLPPMPSEWSEDGLPDFGLDHGALYPPLGEIDDQAVEHIPPQGGTMITSPGFGGSPESPVGSPDMTPETQPISRFDSIPGLPEVTPRVPSTVPGGSTLPGLPELPRMRSEPPNDSVFNPARGTHPSDPSTSFRSDRSTLQDPDVQRTAHSQLNTERSAQPPAAPTREIPAPVVPQRSSPAPTVSHRTPEAPGPKISLPRPEHVEPAPSARQRGLFPMLRRGRD